MKKKFLVSFLSSCIVFAILYSTIFSGIFEEKPVVATDENGDTIVDEDENMKIMFLLMGVDAEDVNKSRGTRTDTMMLTSLDLETGQINILSIPRDTRVAVRGNLDKVNHAHAFGGSDLSIETVKDFLHIDLEYYIKVDYQIVKDVVDAIGGVVVDVPRDMIYRDPTAKPPLNINIKKGEQQRLDGKNAHDFLRWRHNNSRTVGYPDGDVGRIKTQQYFVKELVKQTLQPRNILKLPKLIETYFNNVETNIPMSYVLKMARLADKIDTENLVTNTIPGTDKYINKISYYIYNVEETDIMVKDMFGDFLLD